MRVKPGGWPTRTLPDSKTCSPAGSFETGSSRMESAANAAAAQETSRTGRKNMRDRRLFLKLRRCFGQCFGCNRSSCHWGVVPVSVIW